MHDKLAFYAIRKAVERCHPELAKSTQGHQELERMTVEIVTSLRESGLYFVNKFEMTQIRSQSSG